MTFERVTGVVLAAGQSRRMGQNKLELPFCGSTIGSTVLKTVLASRLDHVLVVTRPEDPLYWIDQELWSRKTRWTQVPSKQAGKGQSCSLRSGIAAAESRNAGAVMIVLGDQPCLSGGTIDYLLNQHRTFQPIYTASSFQSKRQPPVIFSRCLFPALQRISGDKGAGRLLQTLPAEKGVTIFYNEGRDFYDVDTKEDYQWLLKNQRSAK